MKGLIVDDSIVVREDLMEAFKGTEYSIVEASDGYDAIKVFKENPDVSFIICDFNMPKMDGLSALEEIFKMSEGRNIPAVVLTTETSRDLIKRGKEIGVRGWMVKPLDKEMLLKCVDALIAKGRAS